MITLENSIQISVSSQTVFQLVTRPDLWHTWHPASESAELSRVPLQLNDTFDEYINVKAFPGLPFYIRRHTHYTVTEISENKAWQVKGKSNIFELSIRYKLKSTENHTHFVRLLKYRVTSPLLNLLEPLVIRQTIKKQSAIALKNLKTLLESNEA